MSTAWIRAWFTFATIYTGIDLSKEISEQFFAGSRWAQLVGIFIMTAIVWSTRAKLKEMK